LAHASVFGTVRGGWAFQVASFQFHVSGLGFDIGISAIRNEELET